MKLNKERTGVGLSVDSLYLPNELQEKMNIVSEYMTGVFVPSEVSWEGNIYSFYISHRQSLREYVNENGITKKDFMIFVKSIILLFEKSLQRDIDFHEFVFNYECVFIGASFSELEFIYAPDKDTYKSEYYSYNRCSDMVAVISLYIENDSYEKDEQDDEIAMILRILSQWENKPLGEKAEFPKEDLSEIINKANTLLCITEKIQIKAHEIISRIKNKLDIKGDANMRLNGEMLLKGLDYFGDNGENKEINIGRDQEWADVNVAMMHISRKHATIYKENGLWYIKDLKSKNGTYVNGVRIASERPFSLNNGYEICFGIPQSKLIFRLL